LAVSPDGRFLAAGTGAPKSKGVAIVWEVKETKIIAKIDEHRDSVTSLLFHPKKNQLAVGNADSYVYFWEFQEMKLVGKDFNDDAVRGLVINGSGERLGVFQERFMKWWFDFGKLPAPKTP
jgi:WD40 repeat protein